MPDLLPAVWGLLGGDPEELPRIRVGGPPAVLRSTFPVTAVGAAAVGASLLAATRGVPVAVDTAALAVALRSERHVRLDGRAVGIPFDPLSAFHRTSDGWLRLHANYPWHRAAALRVLGCAEADVPAAIAERGALELEAALHDAGGVGAAVRTEEAWRTAAGPPPPLVERRVLGDAAPRPPGRPRVLDLTRVIAGPIATRTLAVHGADVLRLDPPDRPELPLQAYDTLPGKRSAQLDLATHGPVLEELLAGADVVVTGYRPGALDRFGLARPTWPSGSRAWWSSRCRRGVTRGRGRTGAASTASSRRRAGSPTPRAPTASPAPCRPRCSTTPPGTWRRQARSSLSTRSAGTARPTTSGSHWPAPRRGCSPSPARSRATCPRSTRHRTSSTSTRRRAGSRWPPRPAPSTGGPSPGPRRLPRTEPRGPAGKPGSVVSVMSVLAQDPTGLSSPVGQLVVLFGLLASLVLLLRWWWYNRRR